MPETRINNAQSSDLANAFTDFSVPPQQTDAATGAKETEYINKDWSQQLGYYNDIPELSTAIDAKATWTVGKGFKADEITTMLLDTLSGWVKDTFNTIIENMIRIYYISGDSFCEIIRDDEGILLNLKPLDPGGIKIIVNQKGRIIRYEQIDKITNKSTGLTFTPEKMFHLSRNRLADQIHGVSIITKVKEIILMRNEAMSDWKRVMHRNVDPVWIFHMDTDNAVEIEKFANKMDKARGVGENMYVPKGVIVPEQVSIAPNSSLNPLPWINNLNDYFFQACGVPQIIVGGSQEITEATAKIAYLAFQQNIEEEQLFIEEQLLKQLNLIVEFEFPASLENELLSDKSKDGAVNVQPNETTATLSGRK